MITSHRNKGAYVVLYVASHTAMIAIYPMCLCDYICVMAMYSPGTKERR